MQSKNIYNKNTVTGNLTLNYFRVRHGPMIILLQRRKRKTSCAFRIDLCKVHKKREISKRAPRSWNMY